MPWETYRSSACGRVYCHNPIPWYPPPIMVTQSPTGTELLELELPELLDELLELELLELLDELLELELLELLDELLEIELLELLDELLELELLELLLELPAHNPIPK